MTNKFEEHACEFKNESECEEELEQGGENFSESKQSFYNDEE